MSRRRDVPVLAAGTPARMQARQVDLPELGLMGTSWGLGFERFDTPDGEIVGHGKAAALQSDPAVRRAYLGGLAAENS